FPDRTGDTPRPRGPDTAAGGANWVVPARSRIPHVRRDCKRDGCNPVRPRYAAIVPETTSTTPDAPPRRESESPTTPPDVSPTDGGEPPVLRRRGAEELPARTRL